MLDKLKHYKIPLLFFLVLILIASAIVLLFTYLSSNNNEEDEYGPSTTDASEEYETLNPTLLSKVEDSPFKNYESKNSYTRFASAPEEYFDIPTNETTNPLTITMASALSVLFSRQVLPSEITTDTNEDSVSIENIASKYNLSHQKLATANHNILNYYLDNGSVVIICARGSFLYNKDKDSCILVYASYPADGIYFISSPTIETYKQNGVTRSELLSNIDDGIFYILTKESNNE